MKGRSIRAVAVGLLAVGALGVWPSPVTTHADPPVARDAGVIVEWNEITERTLFENAQPIPTSLLFYGFSALAMYDAVVSIEGRFRAVVPAATTACPRLPGSRRGNSRVQGVEPLLPELGRGADR